jgi:Zn-dependent peptidase ImmA (M78 family)/transcriptional regulator with XRE-family HTH domain
VTEVSGANEIAGNLRRLREARGLSQDSLAEASGLSRAGYRNLEAGESEPRAATVMALARALDTTPADLLRASPSLPPARFRSAKRLKEREQLLIRVARELEAYAQLEEVVPDQTARFNPNAYDPGAGTPIERASSAAVKVRKAFGLNDGEPVHDICGLLEGNGIKVLRLPIATEGFFGLSVIDRPWGPAVAVNVWDRITVERWIFTAAHELGHLVLHHDDFDASCSDEVPENEKEADLFAACFLMPKQAFLDEWELASGLPLFDRVLKVKRAFRVSYRTVLHRLGELGYPNVWPRFVAQAQRQTGRRLLRTDEPAPMDAAEFLAGVGAAPARREPDQLSGSDFVVDRRQRLVRKAIQGELISMGRAAEILGLSFVEMRQLAASWA